MSIGSLILVLILVALIALVALGAGYALGVIEERLRRVKDL